VFVAHGELAMRIQSSRPAEVPARPPRHAPSPPPEPKVRYGWCPRCGQIMNRRNFGAHSGIVVDVCREHGTWFDQGELAAALAFVRAGGLGDDATSRD
jgi:Transcription factor zinc-finger